MSNEQNKTEQIMFFIWAQSVVATLGSLFFSEIMGFIPCELCWIQRILMYPLVIIYGTALVKKDWKIGLPGLFMSGIGLFVSAYHYLLQKWSFLSEVGDSCGVVSCNLEYINYFGFITIPFLALVAFIVIFGLHITLLLQQRRKKQ
ncbi:disulfide oxidoreductase [Aquibacillus rhizosphaerae]|uniref:Probable disulfide formation protein n=1 Tax=Aquibacillus rhizosphaerae TaxID=3051431 RepID=A0ABT7LA70_9BACI|nr:disulfide oxidoreductase [Aquibacillus sp. LR5S19]MDL4842771.1 disulfide oxidoreductase [Aquibacillus sp. LR5S19]